MRTRIALLSLIIATRALAADPFANALAEWRERGSCYGETAVCRAIANDATAAVAAERIARELSVSLESARAIGFAELQTELAFTGLEPAVANTALSLLRDAMRRERNVAPLLETAIKIANQTPEPLRQYAELFELRRSDAEIIDAIGTNSREP